MRQLRLLLLAFFVVVAAFFTFTYVRERMNTDYNAPNIQAESETISIPVAATDEDLLAGMTAYDKRDGDVTDTLVVVSRSKFIDKGVFWVNYAAFDSNNNVALYSREATFTDYVSPHFQMKEPLRYASGGSAPDYLANITAVDCVDGDITRQVKITMGSKEAASDTVTRQSVNVQVTNSCGETASLDLTVSMEEYSTLNRPAPALRDYVLYVKKDGSLNLAGNVIGIWAGGNTRSFSGTSFSEEDVAIYDEGLDLHTPGVYRVVYQLVQYEEYYDEPTNYGTAELIVVVEE